MVATAEDLETHAPTGQPGFKLLKELRESDSATQLADPRAQVVDYLARAGTGCDGFSPSKLARPCIREHCVGKQHRAVNLDGLVLANRAKQLSPMDRPPLRCGLVLHDCGNTRVLSH